MGVNDFLSISIYFTNPLKNTSPNMIPQKYRGFAPQPCCMAEIMNMFCIRKNIFSHRKKNLLFLPCNMAAVQNLYTQIYPTEITQTFTKQSRTCGYVGWAERFSTAWYANEIFASKLTKPPPPPPPTQPKYGLQVEPLLNFRDVIVAYCLS